MKDLTPKLVTPKLAAAAIFTALAVLSLPPLFARLPSPPEPTLAQRLSGSTYVVSGTLIREDYIEIRNVNKEGQLKLKVVEIKVDKFIFPEGCEGKITLLVRTTSTRPAIDKMINGVESPRAIFFLRESYLNPNQLPKIYEWATYSRVLNPLPLDVETDIQNLIPYERLSRKGFVRKCPDNDYLMIKESQ